MQIVLDGPAPQHNSLDDLIAAMMAMKDDLLYAAGTNEVRRKYDEIGTR